MSRYPLTFSKFFKCGIRFLTAYPKFKCSNVFQTIVTIIHVLFALGSALLLILRHLFAFSFARNPARLSGDFN